MSLRAGWFVLVCVLGCGSTQTDANEPQTAKEKQLQEARASGEIDKPNQKWGGWRYQGDRKDCFYVFGRKCFKTEKAACSAAGCKRSMCEAIGGGPATVSCTKK